MDFKYISDQKHLGFIRFFHIQCSHHQQTPENVREEAGSGKKWLGDIRGY
jgi:hypothetical protein